MIECESEQPNAFPQKISVRRVHSLRGDVDAASGSSDSAPSPHDYFETALASCKALTAIWFARRSGFPLERVEAQVESDRSHERQGVYRMRVSLSLIGPLSEEQKQRIQAAVERCPIHKLMTSSEVIIETGPLLNQSGAV